MIQKKFEITRENVGLRIDNLCSRFFSKISRSQWKNYGKFICNGVAMPSKTKTKLNQVWEVSYTEINKNEDKEIKPWDFPLEILKESDSWAVINKPIGISVHPSKTEQTNQTIVNALVSHFKKNLSENFDIIEDQKIPRPGLVHRLDKTTSGTLLIAKNNQAHQFFQEHWKDDVGKVYYAIVEGIPPKKGKIESGITRNPQFRNKMMACDDETSKWAKTLFETIERKGNRSLLKIKILTGRTHQIRVHLSSIGFPILGDVLYGGAEAERIFLHAESLTFPDFDNPQKEKIIIESEVPFDLENIKI